VGGVYVGMLAFVSRLGRLAARVGRPESDLGATFREPVTPVETGLSRAYGKRHQRRGRS
jgi:hypothetical protein